MTHLGSKLKGKTMKRTLLLLTIFALSPLVPAIAADPRGEREGGNGAPKANRPQAAPARASAARTFQAPSRPQTAPARPPVVINMSRPAPRTNNPQPQSAQRVGNVPSSYGRVQWQNNPQTRTQPSAPANTNPPANNVQPNRPQANQPKVHYVPSTHSFTQRPNAASYTSPGVKAAAVVHHHPYTLGYVRKKLQKIGVKSEPSHITDRSQMINTDRAHSIITLPKEGPNHNVLRAALVSPRHFNDAVVRDHMGLVNSPAVLGRINQFNTSEIRVNHYYWHQQDGFNYCHYLYPYGYHWYGWYMGDNCFWTRYYSDRWWWYDNDFGRWCFWNEGNWWWQDPNHVGDLYCYNNDSYVPCNSAEDQIVVTSPDTPNEKSYASPDGARTVKVVSDTQDAFLYDTDGSPDFNPIYLATGVVDVQFSSTQSGRPLEILLKLSDGSFDVYDGDGNAYSPGSFDADQAAQSSDDVQTVTPGDPDPSAPDAQTLPMDNGTDPNPDGTAAQ